MSYNSKNDGKAIHNAFRELMLAVQQVYGKEDAPWNTDQNPCRDAAWPETHACCSMEIPDTFFQRSSNVVTQALCVDLAGQALPKCNWNNIICRPDGHITGLGLTRSDFRDINASLGDVGEFRLDLLPKTLEVLELAPYWFSGINTFSQYNTTMFPSLRRLSLQLHTDLNKVIDSIQDSNLESLSLSTPGFADFTNKTTINAPSTLKEFSCSCATWSRRYRFPAEESQIIKGEIPAFQESRPNLTIFEVRFCPMKSLIDNKFILNQFGPANASKLQNLTLFDGSPTAMYSPSLFQALPKGLKGLALAGGKSLDDNLNLGNSTNQEEEEDFTSSTATHQNTTTGDIWKALPKGLTRLALWRFDFIGHLDKSWQKVDWKVLPSTINRIVVRDTDISGSIDATAGVFTSGNLKILGLISTKLSGTVDWSVIGKTPGIYLAYSNFSGNISWEDIYATSFFDIDGNSFTGDIEVDRVPGGISNWFRISRNDFKRGQTLPSKIHLRNCTHHTGFVTLVALSDLGLQNHPSSKDVFNITFLPDCEGDFQISRNNFTGSVIMRDDAPSSQQWLWLAENQLNGNFPWSSVVNDNIGLALNGNKFEGTVDWTTVSKLCYVDLWDNQFDGTVDWGIIRERRMNWRSGSASSVLKLSDNRFTGNIDWATLQASQDATLTYINLANNRFTGPVVDMGELPHYMREIDVSGNLLQGTVDLAKLPYGLVDLRLKQRQGSGADGDICFTSPEAVFELPNVKKFFKPPVPIQWDDIDRIVDPEQSVYSDLTVEYIHQNLCGGPSSSAPTGAILAGAVVGSVALIALMGAGIAHAGLRKKKRGSVTTAEDEESLTAEYEMKSPMN